MLHKPGLVRLLYFSGLAIWTLSIGLNPPWVGTSYNLVAAGKRPTWSQGEAFGLEDGDGNVRRAPIWGPPVAQSPDIKATVRWPWQGPSGRYHIELSLTDITKLLSYGLIATGLIVGLLSFLRLAARDDRVVTLAWSVARWLIIAWIALAVLSVVSMGYAGTGETATCLLLAGVVAGIIGGSVSHSRKTGRNAGTSMPTNKLEPAALANTRNLRKKTWWKPGRMSLLFFVIGLAASCVIAWTATDVAIAISPSRLWGANVDGFGEVSGWMRALTGVGIAALGWGLGVVLWWATWIRGFSIGVITGASALGLLCMFWH
jgi:hypothetical protein